MNNREAFEAWHKKVNCGFDDFSLHELGHYVDFDVRRDWDVWQAVLASQAQQTECQWISVEERLPEENCHLLVACEGGNVATTFYAIDHSFFDHAHGHKLSRKVHGKYSKHFELARQYGYKITHWMYQPPAPEGE